MKAQIQPPTRFEIEELELFVLEELRQHHLHDNIISELCQRMNWDWKQAQGFLEQVYLDHKAELAPREKRLALLIGLTAILDGLGVFALGSLGILWWFFYNPRTQVISSSPDNGFFLRVLLILSMAPAYFVFFFTVAVTGAGIMAKGVISVIRAIW